MPRLKWGESQGSKFEYGIDRGVYYPRTGLSTPWQSLISVKESLPVVDKSAVYIDGVKQGIRNQYGDFSIELEAYTYPSAFEDVAVLDLPGRLTPSKTFDFSYRSKTENGYNLHLVYNVVAVRNDKTHESLDLDVEAASLAWNFYTRPVAIPGMAPSSHLILSSDIAWSTATRALEDVLYGTATSNPRMPSPTEVLSIVDNNGWLAIVDHGNGLFTASGPAVSMLSATEFQIDSPTAVYIGAEIYRLSNY